MRIACSAVLTLLLASAVPSVSVAQDLVPFTGGDYDQRLDHAVTVATVSRVGDVVALEGARVVQDGHGEPFVLGTATLDLRDPDHVKVVFAIENVSESAILLRDVVIQEARLCSAPDRTHPFVLPHVGGRADVQIGTAELQPGAKLTVHIPIAPNCGKGPETLGVLVAVRRPFPPEWSSTLGRYFVLPDGRAVLQGFRELARQGVAPVNRRDDDSVGGNYATAKDVSDRLGVVRPEVQSVLDK